MMIPVLTVVLLTGTFLYMFGNAQFARTRRVAMVPLACAGMEVLAAGLLTVSAYPLLTAVRLSLIAVILVSCVAAMRKDAAMARTRARRQAARQAVKANVPSSVICRCGSAAHCA